MTVMPIPSLNILLVQIALPLYQTVQLILVAFPSSSADILVALYVLFSEAFSLGVKVTRMSVIFE